MKPMVIFSLGAIEFALPKADAGIMLVKAIAPIAD